MTIAAERAEAIRQMRSNGATFKQIEAKFHCGKATIRKALPPEHKHARFINGELRPMPPIPRKPKPMLARPVPPVESVVTPSLSTAPYRAEREHGRMMPDAIQWWDRCQCQRTRSLCPRCNSR